MTPSRHRPERQPVALAVALAAATWARCAPIDGNCHGLVDRRFGGSGGNAPIRAVQARARTAGIGRNRGTQPDQIDLYGRLRQRARSTPVQVLAQGNRDQSVKRDPKAFGVAGGLVLETFGESDGRSHGRQHGSTLKPPRYHSGAMCVLFPPCYSTGGRVTPAAPRALRAHASAAALLPIRTCHQGAQHRPELPGGPRTRHPSEGTLPALRGPPEGRRLATWGYRPGPRLIDPLGPRSGEPVAPGIYGWDDAAEVWRLVTPEHRVSART